MDSETSGILPKGTYVEICPFRRGHSHHYLAHLDGKRGTVVSLLDHGPELQVMVRLEGTVGAISYPAKAIRPAQKEA